RGPGQEVRTVCVRDEVDQYPFNRFAAVIGRTAPTRKNMQLGRDRCAVRIGDAKLSRVKYRCVFTDRHPDRYRKRRVVDINLDFTGLKCGTGSVSDLSLRIRTYFEVQVAWAPRTAPIRPQYCHCERN